MKKKSVKHILIGSTQRRWRKPPLSLEKIMENINHLVEETLLESEIEELLLEVKNLESLKRIQKALNQRKKEVA